MNKGSLLFKAIQENNEAEVSSILNSYPCPAWSEVHDKDKPQSQTDIFNWGSSSSTILEALFAHYGLQIFGCNSNEQALDWATERNYLPVVALLLDKCGAQISAEDKGAVLYYATRHGNLPIATLLLEKCSAQISALDKGEALQEATRRDHLPIVALLLEKCSPQISAKVKDVALSDAAERGNLPLVTLLLEKCAAEISVEGKGTAFRNAAREQQLPVVTFLFEKHNTEISAMTKGNALKNAAGQGYLPIITLLLDECVAEISAEDKCTAFYYAARQDHLTVVSLLLNTCAAEITAAYKGTTLSEVAKRGRLPLVTLLLEKCSEQISVEDKSIALFLAAEEAHPPVVTLLLEKCSAQLSDEEKGDALIVAARKGHLSTLEALLADESVSAVATWNNNAALREAQTRARGDAADYARYQPIANRLLQIPAVAQLAQTQQQHGLDLANRAGFAENSMQALTTPEQVLITRLKYHYAIQYADKSWEVIRAEILSYLEAAYQQSPAKDGYHYVKMLAPGSDFYELPADTLVLKPQDDACIAFYWHEGVVQQRSLPLAQVEEIYRINNKSHLLYQTSQDETLCQALLEAYEIPSPHQDQPLPLAYSASLSPSALVAYYRHLIHGAWRYLSDSNPWMDPAASFVHALADGQRQAIISDTDKELLSYFWLALTDEQVKLEPGFTPAGNRNLLAAALAAINRGHNTDERPVNPAEFAAWKNRIPGIKTTCEDDVKADRPSCSYGVTKRLLENVYGHPYINCPQAQPLDPDILLKRMEAHLVRPKADKQQEDNLVDKLEKLSLPILQSLQHEIGMICDMADETDKIMLTPEQEEQKKQALTPSAAQLTAFIDDCKLWFGESRISDIQATPFICRQVDQEHQHPSYEAFIHYCVNHPLKAFTTVINDAIQALIVKANEAKKPDAKPITHLADHKCKREESTSSSSVTEPDTSENSSSKRKKLSYH